MIKIPSKKKITEKDIDRATQALEIAERISRKVDFYRARRNNGNSNK